MFLTRTKTKSIYQLTCNYDEHTGGLILNELKLVRLTESQLLISQSGRETTAVVCERVHVHVLSCFTVLIVCVCVCLCVFVCKQGGGIQAPAAAQIKQTRLAYKHRHK